MLWIIQSQIISISFMTFLTLAIALLVFIYDKHGLKLQQFLVHAEKTLVITFMITCAVLTLVYGILFILQGHYLFPFLYLIVFALYCIHNLYKVHLNHKIVKLDKEIYLKNLKIKELELELKK